MPFNSDTFVQRLVSLRKKKHLTQEQMSDLLPVSRTGYSAWEQKKSKPDLESLIMLCEFFSVSADYLLGLSDNPARPAATEKAKADKEKSAIGSMLDASVPRDSLAPFDPALHEEILAYARFRQEEFLKNSSKEDAI